MNKKIVMGLCAFFLLGNVSASFAGIVKAGAKDKKAAAIKTETLIGKISSIDQAKNQLILKENANSSDKTIVTTAKIISTLKAGDEVTVVLPTGSNKAQSIKKVSGNKKS